MTHQLRERMETFRQDVETECDKMTDELRRLHAINAELLAALETIESILDATKGDGVRLRAELPGLLMEARTAIKRAREAK